MEMGNCIATTGLVGCVSGNYRNLPNQRPTPADNNTRCHPGTRRRSQCRGSNHRLCWHCTNSVASSSSRTLCGGCRLDAETEFVLDTTVAYLVVCAFHQCVDLSDTLQCRRDRPRSRQNNGRPTCRT